MILPGPRVRGRGFGGFGWWLTAYSLLLIAEKPRHGYEIANELKKVGFPIFGVAQMGVIYRTLSVLEADGLVIPKWDTSTSPPRKVYRITPLGMEYLEQLGAELGSMKNMIDSFMKRYSKLVGDTDEGSEGRSDEVPGE